MKKLTACISVVFLLTLLSGCGATAKMIAAKSQSERTDVFTEVADVDAKPQGDAVMVIRASIKTHREGYFSDEPEGSLHGKPGYPFVLNIDGQAVAWKVDGREDVKATHDEQGDVSRDPEAGKGVKYTLEKKLRLSEGAHRVYLALPEDEYIVEAELALRSGEETILEFKPLYWHKYIPHTMPTFLRGIRKYEVYLNGAKIN